MANAQWMLEVALLLLLGATLFHALRLERALGVLKRDRAVLEELVEGFNDSTRQAESGIERLRAAADGAGRGIARQIDAANKLRDDLSFLTDRSDRLAERLEAAVRAARMHGDSVSFATSQQTQAAFAPSPTAESASSRASASPVSGTLPAAPTGDYAMEDAAGDASPRLRSQAERDLQRALRAGR